MTRSRPGRTQRTTGLLVALALALILAGVVLFVAMASRTGPGRVNASTPPAPGEPDMTAAVPPPSDVPDITEVVKQTQKAELEFEDSKHPGRIAGRISWDALDPLPGGFADVQQPRCWIYLLDGRALHVRADKGRLRMPAASQAPESGAFEGSVRIKMFAARPPGAPAIEPENDVPGMLAFADTMTFDSLLGEIATPDLLTIETEQVEFQGTGLMVRFNQERQRIEYLRVVSGKRIVVHAGAKGDKKSDTKLAAKPEPVEHAAAKPNGEKPHAAGPAQPPPDPIAAVMEEWYRAVFSDSVQVTRGTATLNAESLRVWARTLDSQLPPDAFGEKPKKTASAAPAASSTPHDPDSHANHPARPDGEPTAGVETAAAPITEPAPEQAGPPTSETAGNPDAPIVITWSGPLVLTPLDAEPQELKEDHLALRFSSDKSGLVTLADTKTAPRGWAGSIEYGATSRWLTLVGPAHDATSEFEGNATFEVPFTARLAAPRIEMNLGTGVGRAIGAGMLTASGKSIPENAGEIAGPEPVTLSRRITWTERADLQLRTHNNSITSALSRASFDGSVVARDDKSSISGDSLQAEFTPAHAATADKGPEGSVLARLQVDGHAVALADAAAFETDKSSDLINGTLRADKLDVHFQPRLDDPEQSDPVLLVGTGGVLAAKDGDTITAPALEAELLQDEKHQTVVSTAKGRGGVEIARRDGTAASADEIMAWPLKEIADLTGERVVLSKDAVRIDATQVHLDGRKSEMFVFGGGKFEMTVPRDEEGGGAAPAPADFGPAEPGRVIATWTKAMRFDDIAGRIDCTGDAEVTSTRLKDVVEKVRSDRLILDITPASEAKAAAGAPPRGGSGFTVDAATSNRHLLRAEAMGSILDRTDGKNAEIEMRRYAPEADAPAPSVIADGAAAGAANSDAAADAGRRLVELFYLDGARVIADERAGTIEVPTPGQALIVDRRPDEHADAVPAPAANASPLTGDDGAKGTSRFTWGKNALFTRETGVLDLKGDVELLHKPLAKPGETEPVTRLICMQLQATLVQTSGDATTHGKATLKSADAIGAVYAEREQGNLVADRVFFDAPADTLVASALDGSRVMLMDGKTGGQPTPVTAKRLLWNLRSGRIEIIEAAPITAPR